MPRRNRPFRALWIATVIAAGLASRSDLAAALPDFVTRYAGDTLWALTLFLVLVVLVPARPTWQVAAVALLGAFAVEFSQLVKVAWLDAFRTTRIGALLLGSGFLASDLVCYAVGVGFGAGAEWWVERTRARRS